MSLPLLEQLRARGVLGPLDDHFARALARLSGEEDERAVLAAALASRHVGAGHVCLDLRRLIEIGLVDDEGEPVPLGWPAIGEWLAVLRRSPLVAVEGSGLECQRPLVLDGGARLYLQRYWQHQQRLALGIRARADAAPGDAEGLAGGAVRDLLRSLFPEEGAAPAGTGQMPLFATRRDPDWQRVAALAALERRVCVISGGPGTGKTHTVVKILALLIEQARASGKPPPRIQLVAPTGKAAARLRDSIQKSRGTFACDDGVWQAIPDDAATIHRCLGSHPGSSTRFRHDRDNPLLVDVVLVDEASMVDLALMARLVDALPADARLILLGDKDQLASVEAGAVLGDICNTGGVHEHSRAFAARVAELSGDAIPVAASAPRERGLWDCVVHLTRSYRYGEDSAIGALARAVNAGDADRALEILASPSAEVALVETEAKSVDAGVLRAAVEGFAPYLGEEDPRRQLTGLENFRVLCALRRGPHGVETVNREIEVELARRGLIDRALGSGYPKRPILVTRNDYQLELYNGDVGVVGESPAGAATAGRVAYFASPQHQPRAFALSRLPPHETVFAMTVHKSQGSEFERVAIVLPPEMSPVLSRELLYTAVSRAKARVTLFASRDVLRAAISRRIERASGLRDLLWSAPSHGG